MGGARAGGQGGAQQQPGGVTHGSHGDHDIVDVVLGRVVEVSRNDVPTDLAIAIAVVAPGVRYRAGGAHGHCDVLQAHHRSVSKVGSSGDGNGMAAGLYVVSFAAFSEGNNWVQRRTTMFTASDLTHRTWRPGDGRRGAGGREALTALPLNFVIKRSTPITTK